MTTDGYTLLPGDRASGHADSSASSLGWGRTLPLDDVQQAAAREVDALIDNLEPTLDSHQRRLLHQLRLAAETLGAIRATSQIKRYSPI
jgi:hypothetical protein